MAYLFVFQVKDVGFSNAVQRETLTDPHFNSFDEINFDELLDIPLLLDIIMAFIWDILIG